jgi:hypothetical protein
MIRKRQLMDWSQWLRFCGIMLPSKEFISFRTWIHMMSLPSIDDLRISKGLTGFIQIYHCEHRHLLYLIKRLRYEAIRRLWGVDSFEESLKLWEEIVGPLVLSRIIQGFFLFGPRKICCRRRSSRTHSKSIQAKPVTQKKPFKLRPENMKKFSMRRTQTLGSSQLLSMLWMRKM